MGKHDDNLAVDLASTAAGGREAFSRLYLAAAPKLLASIRRIAGSNQAAEDVLQEAFLRIWHHAGDFDQAIASPMAWMTTIARHAAIDAVRKGAERISARSDAIEGELAERLGGTETTSDPLRFDRLSLCLKQLDDDRGQMVVLAYCHGFSREELASRFGRPIATIKTLLRRSLMALKECLGGT